ncbi:DUF3300 domain-containing protein [Pelotalea chapellei]|uniref:DUF3300 domain-containing protein n=1 Tax=Pelotalea chapellei TaxID=44671 RepID=A0ABS5UB28_9BACT|nr:DUF3300 domain-containing protein [Pelotalea chapellei]MBT1072882.1 DUF3300 domain-containing protein [Pelotalea chapellei]
MKKIFAFTSLFIFLTLSLQMVWAQGLNDETAGNVLYSVGEIEDLVAPIALYPDPLIAQILPAATFIEQLHEAAILVRQYGGGAAIDGQAWDVSVKAIAHYPDVLYMLDQQEEWTVSLGEAFANQQAEVMVAIQTLRTEARDAGNLVSSSQLQVVDDGGYVRIYPAEPERIYIPVYDPQVVYYEPAYPSYSLISFGIGFSIGSWLNRDCDWYGRRIYYHGWNGGGWVRRSSPYVIRNTTYVNNRYRTITINRRMLHDGGHRIGQAPRNRRQLPGRPVPRATGSGGSRAQAPRTKAPRNNIHRNQPDQRSGSTTRGRDGASGQRNAPVSPATPSVPALPSKSLPHQVPLPRQAPLPRQEPLEPPPVSVSPPSVPDGGSPGRGGGEVRRR